MLHTGRHISPKPQVHKTLQNSVEKLFFWPHNCVWLKKEEGRRAGLSDGDWVIAHLRGNFDLLTHTALRVLTLLPEELTSKRAWAAIALQRHKNVANGCCHWRDWLKCLAVIWSDRCGPMVSLEKFSGSTWAGEMNHCQWKKESS